MLMRVCVYHWKSIMANSSWSLLVPFMKREALNDGEMALRATSGSAPDTTVHGFSGSAAAGGTPSSSHSARPAAPRVYKIVVLGAAGVGKTSVLKRFVYNTFAASDARQRATLSVDYLQRSVLLESGERVMLHMWDTAGQERYAPMASAYYRDAHAVLYVYACNDSTSLRYVARECIERTARDFDADSPPLRVLLGTKTDLYGSERTEADARTVVEQFALDSDDRCSALTGDGVADSFARIAAKLLFMDLTRTLARQRAHDESTLVQLGSALRNSAPSFC